MKIRRWIVLTILVALTLVGFLQIRAETLKPEEKDPLSGATSLVLEKAVPEGLAFTVDGEVKQTYRFTSQTFRLMAKTRIRTFEITPGGEMMGAYIYTGVPVLHFMEGVVAQKTKKDSFFRPLDMIVVFTSASGQTARFSYGELWMTRDDFPVTLAYVREPLNPSKEPEKYTKNKYKEGLTGLRLVCPRERDTSRYLDNVVRMTFILPATPDELLPKVNHHADCKNLPDIQCIEKGVAKPAVYQGIPDITFSHWFRTGHGRGIRSDQLDTASGYHLASFLKKNFPGCGPEDFFLFVGGDGYRCLFSGREIFGTDAGEAFMLIRTISGKPTESGLTIGAVTDFFLDRSVRFLTHIVRL
ncbi:MAG: hypothetical protein ACM3SY_02600 [Candidatus Omnitrophota bacterium]